MTAITPTTNFSSELASALKENSYGLKEYQVIRETQLESVATLVLLEGDMVTVSLSPQGFQVRLSRLIGPVISVSLPHDRQIRS